MIRDLACAAIGWLLAIAYWIAGTRLPRSLLSDEIGADGLPHGLAVALAAVSTLIAARALLARFAISRERGQGVPSGPVGGQLPSPDPVLRHLRALGVAAIGFAYLAIAPELGYLAAVTLLVAATARCYGQPFSWRMLAIAACGATVLWLVFARLLGLAMPSSPWLRLLA